MTYYPDLSLYAYGELPEGCRRAVNVGWLTAGQPYARGAVPNGFVERLRRLAEGRVNLTRGYHFCELCVVEEKLRGNDAYEFLQACGGLGNGEIVIRSDVCYLAPAMVAHYVAWHDYAPPPEFIEAVLA